MSRSPLRSRTARGPWVRGFGVIVRQLALALLTLFLISIITFGATSVRTSEDIARQQLGVEVTREQLEAFKEEHGLDEPFYSRYADWLSGFARGDWGTSFVTSEPVKTDVLPRLIRTAILSVVALLVALVIAIPLGVYTARNFHRWPDILFLVASVIVAALPEFVVGIALLYLFAVQVDWLPVDSATALTFASSFRDQVKAYVLPALTLVIAMVPYLARIGRASAREALVAPYTQAALLRGLSRRVVIWDHAMRNAAVPLVNAVALNVIYLLGGVIVVENVFAFPGLGQGLVQAISTADTVTVLAITMLIGAMFVSVSLVADFLVAYLNPRLRVR
jgi:peptide/nickel transport system permease protein